MYPYQIDAADVTQWIKYPSDAFVRIRFFIPLLRRCYLQISRPASVTFRHSSRAERNRILFLCPSDNLASLLHSPVLGTRRCSGKAKFCLTGAKDLKENSYVLCAPEYLRQRSICITRGRLRALLRLSCDCTTPKGGRARERERGRRG